MGHMTFRGYLIVMTLASVAAWAAWIVVLVSIDPTRTGPSGFAFFYLTLALALVGTLSIAGAGARVWLKREELASRHVTRAFRQGLLFTLLILGTLLMLPSGFMRWWSGILLVLSISLIELACVSAARSGRG